MSTKIKREPIAIVGIGCRLPGGASTPDKFWDILINKTDAIRTVPEDRWDFRKFYNPDQDQRNDKIATTQGGFLFEDVHAFDSDFFEVSPREAKTLDPQQRLLMEVSYEAIEDAGIQVSALSGSKTGVFMGGFTFDYTILQLDRQSRHLLNPSGATGSMLTMIANKLSYLYNLKGPSFTVDTACSSSLVAIHYACKEIWAGECDMAMAGGVNLILIPAVSVVMSSGKFLSKDGRCRTFDQDASGYVRGEGGAVIILKPLEKALKDGDKIYGLIRSSGVNQDGRTNGITTPSYSSQKALIKKVYQEAEVDINQLRYIEAHGTGTQVGDPIEFKSLNDALHEVGYQPEKCLVGSVKTNIGHLEAGAGVAGLIKAVLCLKNKTVPPNLHFNNPNPKLNYEQSKLRVTGFAENISNGKPALAAVNSFGYGGTNAHVLLEEFIPADHQRPAEDANGSAAAHFVFPLSASNAGALTDLAAAFKSFIAESAIDFNDILYSAVCRRSPLRNRLAIAASSKNELIDKLEHFLAGDFIKGIVAAETQQHMPKTAFVFTGMGPQWWKMGRELYAAEPCFRKAVDHCDVIFSEISGWSILDELLKDEAASNIKDTQVAQPANFIIQYALTTMLAELGVKPDAYVGHSVGEIASTYFSGALTLEEALIVCYHRSRLQSRAAGTGAMLAASLSPMQAGTYIARYNGVSIAAVNSHQSVTLAGDEDGLAAISEELNMEGIFNKVLDVEVPYHSSLMDPIMDDLLEALSELKPNATTTDLYSTVTGDKIDGLQINNDYWWHNVRDTVSFAKAIDSLSRDGYELFIEVGPHPVLKNSILECLKEKEDKVSLLHMMNRKEPEVVHFYTQLATLFTLGYPVNLAAAILPGSYVELPKYSWQRSAFWSESVFSRQDRLGNPDNLFLNNRAANFNPVYEVELTNGFFPFMKDHRINGRVIFPGAGYIASAISFAEKELIETGRIISIEDIAFHQLLFLSEKQSQYLNINFYPKNNQFQISSRMEDEMSEQWQLHASGRIAQIGIDQTTSKIDLPHLQNTLGKIITPKDFYSRLTGMKLEYGDLFRAVDKVWTNGTETLAYIKAPQGLDNNGYFIHPVLLDACFQAMVVLSPEKNIVPIGIKRLHCISPIDSECYCYGTGVAISEQGMIADLLICNKDGNVALIIEGFECRELPGEQDRGSDNADLFYFPEWEKLQSPKKTDLSDTAIYIYDRNTDLARLFLEHYHAEDIFEITMSADGQPTVNSRNSELTIVTDLHEHIKLQNGKKLRVLFFSNLMPLDDIDSISAEKCYEQLEPLIRLSAELAKIDTPIGIIVDIITSGTQQVTAQDSCRNLSAFSTWGFGHVITNEYTTLQARHIDVDEVASQDQLIKMVRSLSVDRIFSYADETDVAIRNGEFYAKRMRRHTDLNKGADFVKLNTTVDATALAYQPGAGINGFTFIEVERTAPAPDEVEIRVKDVSVNFKDYLKVTGKISGKATEHTFYGNAIGMDCSGIVTRTGANVKDYKIGDHVMAFASGGAFRSFATIREEFLCRVPSSLKDQYPSHVLIVFCTVLRCLRDIANLKKGEKILIHNAAGGVGIAAIQYAKYVGAEVFATTSRPEKMEYLRSIGVNYVYGNKKLEFVNGVKNDTNGYGVDVVISALPGEVLHQSVALLAPYGRYIEIGKKDIIDNTGLPLQFFSKNLSFSSMDFDKILSERPDIVRNLLTDLHDYFDRTIFTPLPVSAFPAGKIAQAFGLIEEGQHLGKVVVDMDHQDIDVTPNLRDKLNLSGGTCLISGGTKGLGLKLAQWIIEKGVTHLVLLSRSGMEPAVAADVASFFEKHDVIVKIEKADVTSEKTMRTIINGIRAEMPPLKIVIHSAMVLDDALLSDLSKERFLKVMEPKIDGALTLHRTTANLPLDYFICISSISSLVGNPGQGNYVAANLFLDAFSRYRRGANLNASTINLGVLLETGIVHGNDTLRTILESNGIRGFTNAQVMEGFDKLFHEKPVQLGYFDIDWALWGANNKKSAGLSLFKAFAGTGKQKKNEREEHIELMRKLETMDQAEKHSLTVSMLVSIFAGILKMPVEKVNPARGINLLGIDSVMVVELINAINKRFGVIMAPMEFLSGPSINEIASSILVRLLQ